MLPNARNFLREENEETFNRFAEREAQRISGLTLDTYLSGASVFLRRLGKPVAEIPDGELVGLAKAYILENQRAVHRKYALRGLLEFLGRPNLYLELAKTRPRQPPRRIARKDVDFPLVRKLVDGIPSLHLRFMIMMQYDAGERVGAVLKAREGGFGVDGGMPYAVVAGKRGAIRTVYLSGETDELHRRMREEDGLAEGHQLTFERLYRERSGVEEIYIRRKRGGAHETVPNPELFSGRPWRRVYSWVYDALHADSSRILGHLLTTHWFRHSRITHLLRSGYTLLEVQRVTGQTLEVLKGYAAGAGLQQREIMAKEEPEWTPK